MNGKTARQLRRLTAEHCNLPKYPSWELNNPDGKAIIGTNAYVIRTDKGEKYVLNPEGEHEIGELRFDILEAKKDIYELRCDPIRAVYKLLKKQYKKFNYENSKVFNAAKSSQNTGE